MRVPRSIFIFAFRQFCNLCRGVPKKFSMFANPKQILIYSKTVMTNFRSFREKGTIRRIRTINLIISTNSVKEGSISNEVCCLVRKKKSDYKSPPFFLKMIEQISLLPKDHLVNCFCQLLKTGTVSCLWRDFLGSFTACCSACNL